MVSALVRRVQTVLTEDEYRDLSHLAEVTQKPISVLIREALQQVHLQKLARERRMAAVEELLAMELPVSDWPQMEEEIIRGAMEQ